MKRPIFQFLIITGLLTLNSYCFAYCYSFYEDYRYYWINNFCKDIICDYSSYYGKNNLIKVGGVLAAGGIMANTKIDNSIHRFWQDHIRSRTTDNFFKRPMSIGSMNYFKFYIGGMVLGHFTYQYDAGNILYRWGYRSLRAMFLISPQEVFLSWVLGSGRPNYGQASTWKGPHKHRRAGCSGHAFNGAVPFLTMAMMTENPYLKGALYVISTLPGLSRLNNDTHYFSQVFIGWSIAYLSAKTVDATDCMRGCSIKVTLLPSTDWRGARLSACVNF